MGLSRRQPLFYEEVMEKKRRLLVAALPMELPETLRDYVGRKTPALVERDGRGFVGVTGVGRRNVSRFYRRLDELGIQVEKVLLIGFAGSIQKSLTPGKRVTITRMITSGGQVFSLVPLGKLAHVTGLEVGEWTDASEKRRLGVAYPDVGVIDMETGAHAEECARRGISLSVLRVVTDGVGERLPPLAYIFEDWEYVVWKRFFSHLWYGIWGLGFSWRLWKLREALAGELKKLEEWHDLLENT